MSDEASERELSQLESLPGELRNRIYRYAVVEEELVKAATCVYDGPGFRWWRSNEPALARTCKKLREEVLPIYYAENCFEFNDKLNGSGRAIDVFPSTVNAWLDAIGDAASHIVRVGAPIWVKRVLFSGRIAWNLCDVTARLSNDMESVEFQFLQRLEGQLPSALNTAKVLYEEWINRMDQRPISSAMVLCRNYLANAHA